MEGAEGEWAGLTPTGGMFLIKGISEATYEEQGIPAPHPGFQSWEENLQAVKPAGIMAE